MAHEMYMTSSSKTKARAFTGKLFKIKGVIAVWTKVKCFYINIFFSQREIGRAREKRMKFLIGISQNLENNQHSYSVVQICLSLDNVPRR